MRKILAALLLCSSTVACADQASEVPPELVAARQDADRRACLSQELVQQAEEQLQTLQATIGDNPTGAAVSQFARAFLQHAQLRLAAYSQTDSAFNHSATPADSTRHARAAEQFQIRTPEPSSVEANVIVDYERKLAALLADADHPCNWQAEVAGETERP